MHFFFPANMVDATVPSLSWLEDRCRLCGAAPALRQLNSKTANIAFVLSDKRNFPFRPQDTIQEWRTTPCGLGPQYGLHHGTRHGPSGPTEYSAHHCSAVVCCSDSRIAAFPTYRKDFG